MNGRANLAAVLLAVIAASSPVGAGATDSRDAAAGEPIPGQPLTLVRRDLSAPLPALVASGKAMATPARRDTARALSVLRPPDLATRHRPAVPTVDPLLQARQEGAPIASAAATPAPLVNFPGLDADTSQLLFSRVAPPDTVGAAGPDFYVQMINLISAVYDKDGSVCGSPGCIPTGGEPFATRDLWNGFGGICEVENDGDPIVLYDHLADRWLFSQFAISGGDTHQCFAVSETGDPRGAYLRYDFELSPGVSRFDDYPKIGLWPDAYVMTVNEFNSTGSVYHGAVVFAFERAEMLAGGAAGSVRIGPLSCPADANDGPCFFSLQPGHLAGAAPPPGTPNPIVMAFDDLVWGEADEPGPDGYRLWELDFDWAAVVPPQATLTPLAQVDAVDFDANLCGFPQFDGCIEQPSPGNRLDDLGQFTMYRAQVRDWTDYLSLVVNHTVDVTGGGQAGIRWAELRHGPGGWTLHQSGTHSLDGDHRWMGSIAMNGAGDIALGFSQSSTTTYPSVVYTTREFFDPAGTLAGGEVTLHAGTGSQTGTANRWGDYSAMTVDPVEECTFWYTQEYYESDASFDFKTRIGAFTMPGPLRVAPAVLGFGGAVMPGFKTGLATIGNRCSGGGSIDVTVMILTNAANFSLDPGTGTCGSTAPTIASNDECTIGVTFVPGFEGLHNGLLTIDSTGTGTTHQIVDLRGAGCVAEHKDLEETTPVAGTVSEIACRTITAGPYPIVGNVAFLAGESLSLETGFSVASGASFAGGTDTRLIP